MKQKKTDRRSRRSHTLATNALMELLSEKRYEEITVQDILDRAGIGRSTFYNHYYDKDDLHASVVEEMIEEMNEELDERHAGHGILPSLELFQHIQQDRRQFHAVAGGAASERLWSMMRASLARTIEEAIRAAVEEEKQTKVPFDVVAIYLAGTFLSMLKWWIKDGMQYSPEEMDRMFRELAFPGVWAALEKEG